MAEDAAASSRKEKRAKRDAERAAKFRGGSKKSKPEPAAVPEDVEDEVNAQIAEVAAPTTKSLKKHKKAEATEQIEEVATPDTKSSKKRKRTEDNEQTEEQIHPVVKSTDATSKKKRKTEDVEGAEAPGNKRFIVFCGNLPYSTTDQSLERHFEKLKPFSLRHRTDPATGKSKGFAFIEFEGYDRLKTCLKLYHHSYFDPEDPNARDPEEDPTMPSRMKRKAKGRKINVELSAGGGGNTDARKEKIKAKNERLDGQRQRRQEAERKEKEKERKKKGLANGSTEDKSKQVKSDTPKADEDMGGMHPSRLARIQ